MVLHTPTIAPDDVARAVGRVLDGWQMNVPDLDLPAESIIQCDWLRDIFGNPFHPVSLFPSVLAWNDGAIQEMAKVIYDERRFDDLPLLADALEDAGCADAAILVALPRAGLERVRLLGGRSAAGQGVTPVQRFAAARLYPSASPAAFFSTDQLCTTNRPCTFNRPSAHLIAPAVSGEAPEWQAGLQVGWRVCCGVPSGAVSTPLPS